MLDTLTLDQLRVFVAIAEHGSFSAAARSLRRVQSAISQTVRTMETALGVPLFDRGARRPTLTSAGNALLRDAIRLLEDVDAFKRRAEAMASGFAPELSLAVDQVFPSGLLIDSLRAFRTTYPRVPVTLYTEGLGATEQRLRNDLARLAIYSPLLSDSRGLEMEFFAKVRIVPVVAASHPLAVIEGSIGQAELRRHVQLVLTDRAQSTQGLVLSSEYWMFADQFSRLEYMSNGFGWSFAPLHLVRDKVERGEVRILDFEVFNGMWLSLPLYFVYQQGHRGDPGMDWLIRDLTARRALYGDDFIRPEDEIRSIPYPLAAMSVPMG